MKDRAIERANESYRPLVRWLCVLVGMFVAACVADKVASPDVRIPIASPEAEVKINRQTTVRGEAEGMMGPFYAAPYSAPKMIQTTIGTISLGSGWLWGPVGLLVMVALQRDRKARTRGLGLDRVVDSIEHASLRHPNANACRHELKRHIHCKGLAVIGPTVLEQSVDAPEREINKAVRRLEKGKR